MKNPLRDRLVPQGGARRIELAQVRRRYLRNLAAMAVAFTVIGVALILQPGRWSRTPAYANLLLIFNAPVWGGIYLIVAAVMVLSIWQLRIRWLLVTAHTLSFGLVLSWFVAFVIRYLTDANTTPVTAVSWAMFIYLLTDSATSLDAIDSRVAGMIRDRR